MTPTETTAILSHGIASLPLFDGFPYLNTRLVPALYHISLLPEGAPESSLINIARTQAEANRLDLCLVMAPARAIFFFANGRIQPAADTPRGGTLLTGSLALPVHRLETGDLRRRQRRLNRIVEHGQKKGGYILGDLTKGGHAADSEERSRLGGVAADGTPRGLDRCDRCHDWRGTCLDPSETFAGQVMLVHCLCDNHNRCARCGTALTQRRLNANFYDPSDGQIWHVPGFSGLGHRCPASTERPRPTRTPEGQDV